MLTGSNERILAFGMMRLAAHAAKRKFKGNIIIAYSQKINNGDIVMHHDVFYNYIDRRKTHNTL